MSEEIPIVESDEMGIQLEVYVNGKTLKKVLLRAFIEATEFVKDVVPNPFFIPTVITQKAPELWSVRMMVCKQQEVEQKEPKKLTYLAMRSVV